MKQTKRSWSAVDVVVYPDAVEAVESAFNSLDALGTEVDSLRKSKGQPLTVTAFFDDAPSDADIRSMVNESLSIYGFSSDSVITIAHRTVVETDWLAEWKKYWKATHVGRFVIAPPWEDVEKSEKIVIRIEPNMAFGTGTHETTQLCLKAISERYSPEQSFLDVGTGTGILAIAAAKLGGSGILAYDTDADSIKIAVDNATANTVGEKIKFIDGPMGEDTPAFDFVCANLTLDVITPILPLLVSKSHQVLLLSGILADQSDSAEYELGKLDISDFKIEIKGDWCSILIER